MTKRTLYVFVAEGLIDGISGLTEEEEYVIFDSDSLENGCCPVCDNTDLELEDATKEVTVRGKKVEEKLAQDLRDAGLGDIVATIWHGGHFTCNNCGFKEGMDDSDLIACYEGLK